MLLATLFIILWVNSANCICGKTGLFRLDVNILKGNEIQTIANIHFDKLKIYDRIYVRRGAKRILCEESVKDFPLLEALIFSNKNNIESVEPNAFQNVPNLKHLSLESNKLTQVKSNSFSQVKSLVTLKLSQNRIGQIDGSAFDAMPNLETIHLDENNITYLGNWFYGCPNLKLIDLKRNYITEISSDPFETLRLGISQAKPVFVTLAFNRVNVLHAGSYSDAKEKVIREIALDLEGNQIESLETGVLKNYKLQQFILTKNYIDCLSNEVLKEIETVTFKTEVIMENNTISCECMSKMDKWRKQRHIANVIFSTVENCNT